MLSKQQITLEVEKAKHKLVSSEGYKNLSSPIEVECERGHVYTSTVESLRKTTVCPNCSREIVNLSGYPPTKKGHRVVSLDQATNVTGISVYDDGQLVFVGQKKFFGELGTRYKDFSLFLIKEVVQQWKPDELVFEDIQYQNNALTHKVLGGLLGICILVAELHDVKYHTVLNGVWQSKFNIKGRGRAEQKRNTVKKAKELFNLDLNDDIADSVLLGYYIVLEKGKKLF